MTELVWLSAGVGTIIRGRRLSHRAPEAHFQLHFYPTNLWTNKYKVAFAKSAGTAYILILARIPKLVEVPTGSVYKVDIVVSHWEG